MSDDLQERADLDTSIAGAVDAMPDIEALERNNGVKADPAPVKREPDGKFAPKQDKDAGVTEVEPEKPKDEPEAKAAEAEDDADYIELPAEKEGEQPRRLKLDEVLDGFTKAQQLQAELEQVKSAPRYMPAEVEREIATQVQARQQLISVLDELHRAATPQPPSLEMLNPNSKDFNPTAFYEQAQQFQARQQERAQIEAARQQAMHEQAEQMKVVAEARYQREMAKALELWPELKDRSQAARVVDGVTKAYGFTPQEVQAIDDARVLAVLKDALAFRQGQAAKETAVKVVKAKPKLVRAQARDSQTGKQAQFAAANQRLTASHSIEDAAEAIGALLG